MAEAMLFTFGPVPLAITSETAEAPPGDRKAVGFYVKLLFIGFQGCMDVLLCVSRPFVVDFE